MIKFYQLLLLTALMLCHFTLLAQVHYHEGNAEPCGQHHVEDLLRQRRPGFDEELELYQQVIGELSNLSSQQGLVLTIPVVVHVVSPSGTAIGSGANLSDARIQAQIARLNRDFRAQNPNFVSGTPQQFRSLSGDPEIQFCLARLDPNGNPSTGIVRHSYANPAATSTIENTIKPATTWPKTQYLNIWTVAIPGTSSAGGTLGYAYLPTTGITSDPVDGIVMDYRWFGDPTFSGVSGDCRALTHEAGHYLGLPHIWGSTTSSHSCNDDDGISDTPVQLGPTANTSFSCGPAVTPPVSCSTNNLYCDYMDYLDDDACYTMFTSGQINVMRNVLLGVSQTIDGNSYTSRASLRTSAQTRCSLPGLDAGISAVAAPSTSTCGATSISPSVTIRNYGTTTLTSASIRYTINGGAATSFAWTGSLTTGNSANVTLPAFTPPGGAYVFMAYTVGPNGGTDGNNSNDTTRVNSNNRSLQFLPFSENFNGTAFNPTTNGIYNIESPADNWDWVRSNVSAFGAGSGSAFFDNYASNATQASNPSGKLDALVTPTFNFSNVNNATLTFDVAYARYVSGANSADDSLRLYVSTDCGVNFNPTNLFYQGGTTLATAPASANAFSPTSTQWVNKSVSLATYNGLPNVTFALVNISGWGNNMYVDNINITSASGGCNLSVAMANTASSSCSNCNGTATATPSGGTGSYTYLWSTGATTQTINNRCAGTYTVTVTSGANCTASGSTAITGPSNISVTVTGVAASCGQNNGTATATPTGGTTYTYLWSNGRTTQTITGLTAGTYTVTVTSSGCTASGSYAVTAGTGTTVNLPFSENFSGTAFNPSANGIIAFGAPVDNWVWARNIASAFGVGTGCAFFDNYAAAATSQATSPFGTLDALVTPVFNFSSVSNATMTFDVAYAPYTGTSGSAFDSLRLYVSTDCGQNFSPTTLFYQGGTTLATAPASNTAFIPTANQWVTKTVNLSQYNGVSNVAFALVNISRWGNNLYIDNINIATPACTTPISVSTSGNATTCGLGNGTATASPSGGSNYVYQWSNGGNTQTIANLAAGTYTVTVSSGSCTATAQRVVAASTPVSVTTSGNNASCSGNTGTATATATGGTTYNYAWSNGGNTQTISNLSGGTYTVTVTSGQCSTTATRTVTQTGSISVNATGTATICGNNNGSATATPSGGSNYAYAWSNGGNTQTISNLAAGAYWVTVTSGQCTSTATYNVGASSGVRVTMSGLGTSCGQNNGTAAASPSGGTNYTYLWSNGANSSSINGLAAGVYNLTVTSGQCSATATYTVINGGGGFGLQLSTTNGSDCNGVCTGVATAIPSPAGSYLYQWSNGAPNMALLTNVCSGSISVTVTDGNGCTNTASSVLQNTGGHSVNVGSTPVACFGGGNGSASAAASGGLPPYTYLWGNGSNSSTISNLSAGIYLVTVTDSRNCALVRNVTVTQPSQITINMSSTDDNGTGSGTASASASGGNPPYQYSWSNGANGSSTISNLVTGSYSVTVYDASQCPATSSVFVNIASSVDLMDGVSKFDLFPNPTNGNITLWVDFDQSADVTMQLFDITGKLLVEKGFSGDQIRHVIELSGFPSAVYIVAVKGGKYNLHKRVIKQ